MNHRRHDHPGLPMPEDQFTRLRDRRIAGLPSRLLLPVPCREPAAQTDELAALFLAESAQRRLESGEILLLSEEATLDDLETAAAAVTHRRVSRDDGATDEPRPEDGSPLSILGQPVLMSSRIWSLMDWRPELAEFSTLLVGALRSGQPLSTVMLVGHVETFPERVEHLTRLRELVDQAGGADNLSVIVAAWHAASGDAVGDDFVAIADAAAPSNPQMDVRHARALANIVLGPIGIAVR